MSRFLANVLKRLLSVRNATRHDEFEGHVQSQQDLTGYIYQIVRYSRLSAVQILGALVIIDRFLIHQFDQELTVENVKTLVALALDVSRKMSDNVSFGQDNFCSVAEISGEVYQRLQISFLLKAEFDFFIGADWIRQLWSGILKNDPVRVNSVLERHRANFLSTSLSEHYQRNQLLAEGTYGKVYHGDPTRPVVIKEMQHYPDSYYEMLQSFTREIAILTSIVHPHIVPIRSVCLDESRVQIILPYYPLGDLKRLLIAKREQREGFSAEQVRRYMKQLLSALKYLHEKQVIHGDLKPDNILISEDERNLALQTESDSILKSSLKLR